MTNACTTKQEEPKPSIFLASSLHSLKNYLEAELGESSYLSFQGSSAIARQVSSGARCDGIILLDDKWQALLVEKNLVSNTPLVIAKNSLILAGQRPPQKGKNSWAEIINNNEKIIMADPAFVPLGRYSEEAIKKHQALWPKLKPRLHLAHSAQAALVFFRQKAAPWAILFASDADEKLIFTHDVLPLENASIEYKFLPCTQADPKNLEKIYKTLAKDSFKELLLKTGFKI